MLTERGRGRGRSPGAVLTKHLTRRHFRPPTVAGFAIVLLAAGILSMIALFDGTEASGDATAATPSATAGAPPPGIGVRVVLTTNVRAGIGGQGDVLAIIPGDRTVEVNGRTEDAAWIQVTYPPDSNLRGWVPARNTVRAWGDVADAGILSVAAPAGSEEDPGAEEQQPDSELPDLAITDAFVQPGGSLTVRIENVGQGQFDGTVGLHVLRAEGDIVGVLDIQRTLLEPGRSATVDTRVAIEETGSYVIELDRRDEVEESNEFNNTYRVVLVPSGG